ncbi:MAG: aminotransferase class V-fold PLP-dependent enzyme [Rubrivivax sp.]|nr:aminotransferase class V-fold PLP-dependent enzyme [Rubrivivax sp.]
MTRDDALALDAQDPLAPLRAQFDLPQGVIYLDGNSLGVLPRSTAARVQQVVAEEWGQGLIRSWNSAGWMALPERVGDKIARLVGAGAGELVVADSTSVNLFKVLSAALAICRADAPERRVIDAPERRFIDAPERRFIVSERSNFPTDLYIAQALARERGFELLLCEPDDLPGALTAETAVLMLTHVNYRTGRMHDMAALTQAAHAAGALVIWDLAHSAGAVPVDLKAGEAGEAGASDGVDWTTSKAADFAVGCGYKYLNGGPGAPAFVWVHPRHVNRFWQPLAGWIGHAAPFDFTPGYRPAAGIARYLCGTPAVLSLAALECGVDSVLAAERYAPEQAPNQAPGHGGMAALRRKSLALTRLFAERVQATCPALTLASPAADAERGSQVCFSHPTIGYAVVQALIARGVIGDFRAGDKSHAAGAVDILRFGFTPLYLRFVDAWDAAEHLRQVLDGAEWQRPEFNQRHAVT